jgi:hypothetical protein
MLMELHRLQRRLRDYLREFDVAVDNLANQACLWHGLAVLFAANLSFGCFYFFTWYVISMMGSR